LSKIAECTYGILMKRWRIPKNHMLIASYIKVVKPLI
jgi:hypothetical protein